MYMLDPGHINRNFHADMMGKRQLRSLCARRVHGFHPDVKLSCFAESWEGHFKSSTQLFFTYRHGFVPFRYDLFIPVPETILHYPCLHVHGQQISVFNITPIVIFDAIVKKFDLYSSIWNAMNNSMEVVELDFVHNCPTFPTDIRKVGESKKMSIFRSHLCPVSDVGFEEWRLVQHIFIFKEKFLGSCNHLAIAEDP
mmetsp:Transcript_17840/g.58663  ORF Transcript_17840/g.58663 Transcript_17840/m.58663 type:complete len:197 (-) Transcript_17840:639-1229(-)